MDIKSGSRTQNEFIISGPVSLYIGEYKGKRYYFFGDRHFSFSENCGDLCEDLNAETFEINFHSDYCYTITRFIDMICKSHHMVDIFLEHPYEHKVGSLSMKKFVENNKDRDYLGKILYTFSPCMERPISDRCIYKNARFHYIDIRQGKDKVLTGHRFISDLYNIVFDRIINKEIIPDVYAMITLLKTYFVFEMDLKLLKIYMSSTNYINDIKKYLIEFKELYRGKNWDEIQNHVFKFFSQAVVNIPYVKRNNKIMTRISAQFQGLEDQGDTILANNIKKFIVDKYSQMRSTIPNNYDDLYQTAVKLDTTIENQGQKYLRLSSFLMDAYTLSRMFRIFPNTYHVNSSRVISYAGNAHIETYKEFFQLYLGVIFKQATKKDTRCISIKLSDLL